MTMMIFEVLRYSAVRVIMDVITISIVFTIWVRSVRRENIMNPEDEREVLLFAKYNVVESLIDTATIPGWKR